MKALEKERIFRNSPFDAGLKTHKLKGKFANFWAFSIDHSVRILFSFESDSEVHFHAVGGHEVYE